VYYIEIEYRVGAAWERIMTGAHKNEGYVTLGIDKRLVNDGMGSI